MTSLFSSKDILDTIGREQVTAGNFIGPTVLFERLDDFLDWFFGLIF